MSATRSVARKTFVNDHRRPFEVSDNFVASESLGGRRGRYGSTSILQRRNRMLKVAQAMIAEGGPGMLTLRELGRRAGVSVTTIYATYGDKETLIAAAIQDFYYSLPIARSERPTTLKTLLEFFDVVRDGILENRTYARGFATLYFSSTVDPRVRDAIVQIVMETIGAGPWLSATYEAGEMAPGLTEERAVSTIVDTQLVVLRSWGQGRLSDAALGAENRIAFLIAVRGIAQGRAFAEADEALTRLLAESRVAVRTDSRPAA